jgi:hypothetical protein
MPHPTYNGSPIPVFSVPPNWASSVLLRTIYQTVVLESLDTGEERFARRPRCMYGLRFSPLTLSGQESGYIRRIMELAQALPVAMPVWTQETKLTADLAAGATVLAVDDTNDTLFSVLRSYAIIWRDFKTWEVLEVADIDGGEITLDEATTFDWRPGDLVLPILIGRLPRPRQRAATDVNADLQIDFEERFNGLTDQSIVEVAIEELDFEYPSEACRDTIKFIFTQPEGESYRIQIAESSEGPWGDHIHSQGDGLNEIIVNNDYNGEYWFRLVGSEEDDIVYSAVNPQASTIPAPEIEITNLDESDRPMHASAGFVKPYSNVENPWITAEGVYIVPRARLELTTIRETGAFAGEIVSITGAVGATHTWTRNALNPEIDTPNPIREGLANNLAVRRADFGFIIKARSFKDGCQSPITCYLIDRRVEEIAPWYRAFVLSELVTGACDLPSPSTGGESGASCNVNFGSPEGFEEYLLEYAEDSALAGGLGHHPTALKNISVSTSTRGAWYGDYTMHTVVAHYLAHQFSTIYRAGLFHNMQPSWMFGEIQLAASLDGSGSTLTVAPVPIHSSGETIAGPLNTNEPIEDTVTAYINSIIGPSSGPISLKDISLIFTLHHDYLAPDDFSYEPPVVEDPPEEPPVPDVVLEIWWEPWETYADSTDADADTLDNEVGWDGAWVVVTYDATLALEDFETYAVASYPATEDTDLLFDTLLDDGYGFAEFWHFEKHAIVTVSDDFESYTAAVVEVFTELNGGSDGWDGAWIVQGSALSYRGLEDFESYANAVLPDGDSGIGTAGGDFEGNWFVASSTGAGYIYYRINITAAIVPNGNWMGMHEFRLFNSVGTNLATTGTATASAVFSGGTHNADKANDGNATGATGWSNNGFAVGGGIMAWLQIEFPIPRVITDYGVGHYPQAASGTEPAAKNWTLQGSNDGSSWTLLHTVTNNAAFTYGEVRQFTI